MTTIFQYKSARTFLIDSVSERKKTNPDFSIRKWAKEMGFASHTHLVMILQDKRALTLKQAAALGQGLKLSTPEQTYFRALIQLDQAESPEEKQLIELWLSELNPGTEFRVREVDAFLVIAHWVHMAILALTETKIPVRTDADVFARLKGQGVSLLEVRTAIARLKDLGLLNDENGSLKATSARTTTRDDITNLGVREYHKQVTQLAAEAVDQQSLEEREFQSFALSIPTAKIPLAKEMIRRFRTQLGQALTSEPGDEVYQMNLHLFRLSDPA